MFPYLFGIALECLYGLLIAIVNTIFMYIVVIVRQNFCFNNVPFMYRFIVITIIIIIIISSSISYPYLLNVDLLPTDLFATAISSCFQ